MSLRDEIQNFARELEAEANAAFDIWTWLPSYFAAKKAHGDYASNIEPPQSEIMSEAASVISFMSRGSEIESRFFICPCGECSDSVTLEEWKANIGPK